MKNQCSNKVPAFKHIECGGMPDMISDLTQRLAAESAEKETGLLLEVLQDHLGRPSDVEDWMKCERIFIEGQRDQYRFRYDGTDLGWIKREMKFDNFGPPHWTENNYKIEHLIWFIPMTDSRAAVLNLRK